MSLHTHFDTKMTDAEIQAEMGQSGVLTFSMPKGFDANSYYVTVQNDDGVYIGHVSDFDPTRGVRGEVYVELD